MELKPVDGSSPARPAAASEGFRSKRQEFRNYLDKTGTLDALTRGLVALYEQPVKPENPVAFFMENLSVGVSIKAELDSLKAETDSLRDRLSRALAENETLRQELAIYKGNDESAAD